MPTSQQTQFLSEVVNGQPIPLGKLVYFRQRFLDRLYETVLSEFLEKSARGLTKAEVARRIDRKPEQITRWLGAPGNWTLETVSDLLLAISAAELNFEVCPLADRAPRNFLGPDWILGGAVIAPQADQTLPTAASAATTTQKVQVSVRT